MSDKKTDRLKDLARAVRDCEFAQTMAVSHRLGVMRRASMPGEMQLAENGLDIVNRNLAQAVRDLLAFIEQEFK